MRASHRQKASIGGTIGSLVDTHFRDRASLERIRELGQMVASVAALIHELQRERGLSSGALAGGGLLFERDRDSQIQRTDGALTQVLLHWESLLPVSRSDALQNAVAEARSNLLQLPGLRLDVSDRSVTAASAIQSFSMLIDRLLVVIAEAPGTSPHPQVTLSLIALFNFVLAKEYTGQERALGSAVCAQGQFEPFQLDRFQGLDRQRQEAYQVFERHASRGQTEAWKILQSGSIVLAWEELKHQLERSEDPSAGRPPVAQAWFDRSTALIDALRDYESNLLTDLDHLCLQVLAESRSAWEDSQEIPEELEKQVLRRLEKHHLRIQTERQQQRLATRADRAADVVTGSASVIENAGLWRRDLDQLEQIASSLSALSQKARLLALDASIEAVSPAQVSKTATQLSRELQAVTQELERRLGFLHQGADAAVGAFEGFHETVLTLRRDLLEGTVP